MIATCVYVIVNSHKMPSYSCRIAVTFFCGAVFMFAMPFLASLGGSDYNYWTVLCALVPMGLCMGMCNISVFGLAAELKSDYLAGLFLGQGIGSLSLNLLRICTLTFWPASESPSGLFKSTFIYFMSTGTFLTFLGGLFLV